MKYYFYILFLFFSFSCTNSSSSNKPPNILFILVDDAGYSDLSFLGSEINTPNLDALASQSVLFSNFYNNGRCSPSRASLLTGQYPHKVGVGELCNPGMETNFPGYLAYLSPEHKTIQEVLKEEGYATIMSGKWHLGGTARREGDQNKWPMQRGFSNFFGIIGGQASHFGAHNDYVNGNDPLPRSALKGNFYSTDAITDFAIDQIDQNIKKENKPFFLYLSYMAPHRPLEADKELIDKYIRIYSNYANDQVIEKKRYKGLLNNDFIDSSWPYNNENFIVTNKSNKISKKEELREKATHAAMMEQIDNNIGKLVTELKSQNELENTIIFYLSDNGSSSYSICNYTNAPYYGRKGLLREGGIKTPLLMYWPHHIQSTTLIKDRLHIMDIAPTCLDILNIDKTKLDENLTGKSFKETIISGKKIDRQYLFWADAKQQAGIDSDNWKWYKNARNVQHLYDLNKDGLETNNLAKQFPQKIKDIRRAYIKHKVANNILTYDQVKKGRLGNRK